MSNKNRQTDSNDRRHNWLDVFARTRGSGADSNSNEQWHSEVPNIKLSRAFVVVLILHVVAVGGILAFEMFKPKAMNSSVVSTEEEANEVSSNEIIKEDTSEARPDVENDQGYERYIVRSGDSIRAIAESYKISRTELLAANLIDEDHPLVSGRILRIPKPSLVVNGGGESPVSSEKENEDYISLNALPLAETSSVGNVEEITADEILEGNNDEENGFQLLSSVPPVTTSESVPRAIPVSKTNFSRPLKIVKEISTNDFIASGNQVGNQVVASTHTISSGDTLYRIARKYNVSVDSILKLNPGVDPRTLGIGKTLLLP
ncbi:MAG: LysM peptidoglycan-binding domain-containing protein [Verrucomicrobiota bacterium]|nr:LysM peptidoglycan-binding domain-containing protein [Verrucomicrobiota bacterium]